jgi:hypothetical protein
MIEALEISSGKKHMGEMGVDLLSWHIEDFNRYYSLLSAHIG